MERPTRSWTFHYGKLTRKMGRMNAATRATRLHDRPLLPPGEALDRLLEAATRLERDAEEIPLEEALGRILAEEVRMDRAEPPVPRSAMDGYALRSADGGVPRHVRGTVHAGSPDPLAVGPGEAVAVMTGGTVPPGADAVVPVERTRREGDSVLLESPPTAGQHVRAAGEMGEAGRRLLAPGRRLSCGDLAAAAACGRDPLRVRPRPRVAILSTGDEVVPWVETPEVHQVRDSNRLATTVQLRRAGAEVVLHRWVPDRPEELRAAFGEAWERADLVVTMGGVSMGEKDHLPGVFAAHGLECLFHGVAIQPGKPVWAGRREGRWALGLPGNPVSSFVILELFGLPLLDVLGGLRATGPRGMEPGILGDAARSKGRWRYLPASLEQGPDGPPRITPRPEAGSGDWTSLAQADALLELPPHSALTAGDPVRFLRLG